MFTHPWEVDTITPCMEKETTVQSSQFGFIPVRSPLHQVYALTHLLECQDHVFSIVIHLETASAGPGTSGALNAEGLNEGWMD